MTHFQNITTFTDWFDVANNLSSSWLAYGFIVTVFSTVFVATVNQGIGRSLTYASFLTGIVGLFMNMAGYIDYWVLLADIFLFMVGVSMLIRAKDNGGF